MAGYTPGYTVVTTMKNEGAFLLEWVAHHKALGFDALVICTNGCADPTARMAARLQQIGQARHHATTVWAATSIQRSALKQVTRYDEVRAADWVWVCDADEFLVVKVGDRSVRALVDAGSPGVDVISVPWRVFGPAGRRTFHDAPVTALFPNGQPQDAAPLPKAYAKSLWRGLDRFHRIGIHAPVPRPDLNRPLHREGPGGAAWPPDMNPMFTPADYGVAQVNHYALRARDSFLVKRDRGRVNHSLDPMDIDYWDRFDMPGTRCDAIRAYDGAVAGWRQQLLADEVLARLHRRAARWHAARAAQLWGDPANAPLLAALTARGY